MYKGVLFYRALIEQFNILSLCGYSYTECMVTIVTENHLSEDQQELFERSLSASFGELPF